MKDNSKTYQKRGWSTKRHPSKSWKRAFERDLKKLEG